MGATGGAVAILPIIDKAINLLDTGLRCYAMVQVEREKTKQVKYQSEAVINAAEQRTKQVKIQEKEITKRCKLECEKEVNLEKIQLLQLREQLKNEEKQSENSYKLWMSNLEKVERAINNLLEQNKVLLNEMKEADDFATKQGYMKNISDVNEKVCSLLMEINKKMG